MKADELRKFRAELKQKQENMNITIENKYNCDAYDSGYCYRLGKSLTDEEDNRCEDECCDYNKEESK